MTVYGKEARDKKQYGGVPDFPGGEQGARH